MSKRKKKNKKKNRNLSISNLNNASTFEPTTNTAQAPSAVLNSITQVDPVAIAAASTIKKDLIKILVIIVVLMIILIGAMIIRQRTTWLSSAANWFYSSMRLGE